MTIFSFFPLIFFYTESHQQNRSFHPEYQMSRVTIRLQLVTSRNIGRVFFALYCWGSLCWKLRFFFLSPQKRNMSFLTEIKSFAAWWSMKFIKWFTEMEWRWIKMLIEQAETLQKIDQLVTALGVCSYAFARFDVSQVVGKNVVAWCRYCDSIRSVGLKLPSYLSQDIPKSCPSTDELHSEL